MNQDINNRAGINLRAKKVKLPLSPKSQKAALRSFPAPRVGYGTALLVLTILILGGFRYVYSVVTHYRSELANSKDQFTQLAMEHLSVLTARVSDFELDPREARNRDDEAISFAASVGLEGDAFQSRFLKNGKPREALSNVTIRVIASRASASMRYADVSVRSKDGSIVEGLKRSDFEVYLGEKRLSAVTTTRLDVSNEAHAIAILRDKSASTHGLPDTFAGKAISECVTSLANPSRIRLYNFADTVTPLSPLTNDRSLLASCLQEQKPDGGTALYRAIKTAITDLGSRSEQRSLIVFTDGNDSAANESVEDLVATARRNKTRVFLVGLKSPSLNEAVLRQIAQGTGGQYFSAESPEALITSFQVVIKGFQEPVYRIVALHAEESNAPLRLVIGDTSLLIPK